MNPEMVINHLVDQLVAHFRRGKAAELLYRLLRILTGPFEILLDSLAVPLHEQLAP
jgi:hypothetical protein